MTVRNEGSLAMTLLAYEQLTDHGLALPLFATSASANALHVAVPSRPGDPTTRIHDFEVYSATAAVALDTKLHRSVAVGEVWIDVFLWQGIAHVGTRAELWESTGPAHKEMERTSPLSLLALAEGTDRTEAARCSALVHEWLARDWGSGKADRWRLDSYLPRLARRDLVRHFDGGSVTSATSTARAVLHAMLLVQRQAVLELRSPRVAEFDADDLPDLAFAANALGWRLEVVFDHAWGESTSGGSAETARAMVMRLRHGRGRTQTQIPLRAFDQFFRGRRTLRDAKTGRVRTMTLSLADGVRNTMKLQLPEIADMSDPVARFERDADGVIFEVQDAALPEGRRIADLLDEGVQNGSTLKTQGGATWWRMLH